MVVWSWLTFRSFCLITELACSKHVGCFIVGYGGNLWRLLPRAGVDSSNLFATSQETTVKLSALRLPLKRRASRTSLRRAHSWSRRWVCAPQTIGSLMQLTHRWWAPHQQLGRRRQLKPFRYIPGNNGQVVRVSLPLKRRASRTPLRRAHSWSRKWVCAPQTIGSLTKLTHRWWAPHQQLPVLSGDTLFPPWHADVSWQEERLASACVAEVCTTVRERNSKAVGRKPGQRWQKA